MLILVLEPFSLLMFEKVLQTFELSACPVSDLNTFHLHIFR